MYTYYLFALQVAGVYCSRRLFWTDWGRLHRIESANMDGSGRYVIANKSIFWPNGLTLDYAASRLYWTDARYHVIESSRLDGSDRMLVVNEHLQHPFALTLFGDDLFWTDWRSLSIFRASKFRSEGGNSVHVLKRDLESPIDVEVLHSTRQPTSTTQSSCKT